MQIKIYTFGRIKNPEIKQLQQYYIRLVQKYFRVEMIELKDIADRRVSLKEVSLYLLPKQKNIFLSDDGVGMNTFHFLNFFKKMQIQTKVLCFFIGNAFGFDAEVKKRADMLLSFSSMTFPHEFVKILLLEQIFRIGNLWQGGDYHK